MDLLQPVKSLIRPNSHRRSRSVGGDEAMPDISALVNADLQRKKEKEKEKDREKEKHNGDREKEKEKDTTRFAKLKNLLYRSDTQTQNNSEEGLPSPLHATTTPVLNIPQSSHLPASPAESFSSPPPQQQRKLKHSNEDNKRTSTPFKPGHRRAVSAVSKSSSPTGAPQTSFSVQIPNIYSPDTSPIASPEPSPRTNPLVSYIEELSSLNQSSPQTPHSASAPFPSSLLFIIHGWNDDVSVWKDIEVIWNRQLNPKCKVLLFVYESLDDKATMENVAEGFNQFVQKNIEETNLLLSNNNMPPISEINMIAYSTGSLIFRFMAAKYYKTLYRGLLKRVVMLAPANYGSPFATRAMTPWGILFTGEKKDKSRLLHIGKRLLRDLEPASQFLWDLALSDVFASTEEQIYRPGEIMVTILVGIRAYTSWMAKNLTRGNMEGTDGTVIVSGSSLRMNRFFLDQGKDKSTPHDGVLHSTTEIASLLLRDCNHSSIKFRLKKPNSEVTLLVQNILKVHQSRFDELREHFKERNLNMLKEDDAYTPYHLFVFRHEKKNETPRVKFQLLRHVNKNGNRDRDSSDEETDSNDSSYLPASTSSSSLPPLLEYGERIDWDTMYPVKRWKHLLAMSTLLGNLIEHSKYKRIVYGIKNTREILDFLRQVSKDYGGQHISLAVRAQGEDSGRIIFSTLWPDIKEEVGFDGVTMISVGSAVSSETLQPEFYYDKIDGLEMLATAMAHPTQGISLKKVHKGLLLKSVSCFGGEDALDWVCNRQHCSREKAARSFKKLLDLGHVIPLSKDSARELRSSLMSDISSEPTPSNSTQYIFSDFIKFKGRTANLPSFPVTLKNGSFVVDRNSLRLVRTRNRPSGRMLFVNPPTTVDEAEQSSDITVS